MSNYSWTCTSDNSQVTVGEKIQLSCEGQSEGLQLDKLEFKRSDLKEEVPPLSLLEVVKSENGNHLLTVTSYRTGEHDASSVVLVDGQNTISIQGVTWKTQSILSQEQMQKPEPFPSFAPWEMSYPLWFWLASAVFLLAIILIPLWTYKKIEKRKKDFESLRDLETVFEPIDQLFRDLKKLEKATQNENLKESFRTMLQYWLAFLSRSLQIPFTIWPQSKAFRELKRKHFRVYRDKAVSIKKITYDISSAQKAEASIEDFENLIQKIQKLSEDLQNYVSAKGGR